MYRLPMAQTINCSLPLLKTIHDVRMTVQAKPRAGEGHKLGHGPTPPAPVGQTGTGAAAAAAAARNARPAASAARSKPGSSSPERRLGLQDRPLGIQADASKPAPLQSAAPSPEPSAEADTTPEVRAAAVMLALGGDYGHEAIGTLIKVLGNILKAPDEQKFRQLRRCASVS